MRRYSVAARGLPPVEVQATNWITALGMGLEQLGRGDIERLACEVLPNGTVIARDIASGMGYVVQVQADAAEPAIDDGLDVIEIDGEADRVPSLDDTADREAAAQAALVLARDVIPVECGSVILEQGGEMTFVSSFGAGADKLAGVKLPPGVGLAGYAMQKKRSVVLSNASEDPRHFGEVDKLTGVRTREIACIPVATDDRVFGVLEMLNLPPGRRFTREDVHKLQGIATALAARLDRPG